MVLVKFGFIIFYIEFEGEVYVFKKEEGGCYIFFFVNYCFQFYVWIIDVIGIIKSYIVDDGSVVEMVMFGDCIKMIVEFINSIVIEQGMCFVICEGGCIIGVGVVFKILKQFLE